MPLPKTPAYGDAAKLDKLASGTKLTHGTYGPTIQRTPAGRPTGSTGTSAPRQGGRELNVPPATQALMRQMAEAEATRQFWLAWARDYPGPNSEYYLARAEAAADEAAERLYGGSPNFE